MSHRNTIEGRLYGLRQVARHALCLSLILAACDTSGRGEAGEPAGRHDASEKSDAGGESVASPDARVVEDSGAPDGVDASRPHDAGVAEHGVGPDAGTTDDQPAERCAVHHGGCDPLVACSVKGTRVRCGACPSGYRDKNGDGTACQDIDECKADNGGCGDPAHWICKNKAGAPPECTDRDECGAKNGGCEQRCVNLEGSFRCACDKDYDVAIDRRSCVHWDEAAPIAVSTSANAYNPQVELDDAGNAIVVWMAVSAKTGAFDAWVNRYTPGDGWGTPMLVGSDIDPAPSLAVNGSGNAMVVWSSQVNVEVQGSYYTDATGWSPPTSAGSTVLSYGGEPQVALDDQGNAIVVWTGPASAPGELLIWANRYVPASGWGVSASIEAATGAQNADLPYVVLDHHGNATAVWEELGVVGHSGVLANRYVAGSGWGTEAVIGSTGGVGGYPELATGAEGDVIVVWSEDDGTYVRARANRFTLAHGWEGDTLISPAEMTSSRWPELAMDEAGDALAVWFRAAPDSSRAEVWASRYQVGSGWSEAASIDNDDLGDATLLDIEGDAQGNALAVWHRDDGVRLNRYDVASGWGAPVAIGTSAANAASVAVSSTGHAMVVWTTADSGTVTLWGQRFEIGTASP